ASSVETSLVRDSGRLRVQTTPVTRAGADMAGQHASMPCLATRAHELEQVARAFPRVKAADGVLSTVPAHFDPAGRLGDEGLEGVAQRMCIVDVDQVPGYTVAEDVRNPTDSRGNDRQSGRQGFQADQRIAVGPGGQGKDVGG